MIKLKNILKEGFGEYATIEKQIIEKYITELKAKSKRERDYSKKVSDDLLIGRTEAMADAYSTIAKELTKLLKRS